MEKRGERSQQVARAGELFVAAELNKRGGIATLYLTNTPRVDVIATDQMQRKTASIQVKSKSSSSTQWQLNIDKLKEESQRANESDFIVLVDLGDDSSPPSYYVCSLKQFAAERLKRHEHWLKAHGGSRPSGSKSPHHAVRPQDVVGWRDRWDLLGIIDSEGL